VADAARYPVAARVARAVEEQDASADPERAFAFGLARVIDGIEAYVAERTGSSVTGRAAS
jgi:hypothetical protein